MIRDKTYNRFAKVAVLFPEFIHSKEESKNQKRDV